MAETDWSQAGSALLRMSPDQLFQRNQPYIANGTTSFGTNLSPEDQLLFQAWAKNNKVPYDPSATSDYDMRGFWSALTTMDPRARTAINANDGMMHFPDTWKTPYHQSFSNESQYANSNAPRWINNSQLAAPDGRLIYDELKGR